MKNVITSIVCLLMWGCSSMTPEEQAAQTALYYYQLLQEGKAVEFMEGKAGVEEIPNDYAEQLLKATELYISDIQTKHGGVQKVGLSDNAPRRDSIPQQVVYAFLILSYNDSTQEEITVPMVEQQGEWRMK